MTHLNDFIAAINSADLPLIEYKEGLVPGVRLVDRPLPVSIKAPEFDFLRAFVREHGCRSGLDIATGLGISALALASEIKGRVVTIDSYEEETLQRIPKGKSTYVIGPESAQGFTLISGIKKLFNLRGLQIVVGRVPECLTDIRGTFDIVFLDCPKSNDDFSLLITAIRPYLAKVFAVFLHDSHTIPDHREIALDVLGLEAQVAVAHADYPLIYWSNYDTNGQ